MHDIGDMRYATMPWCLGIWPWFGMAFETWHFVGHLVAIWSYMWPSPMLFALYSISLLESNTVCLSRPPTPVYMSSTPGLCKAWELVALGHENMPVRASICIALVLLCPTTIPRFPAEHE